MKAKLVRLISWILIIVYVGLVFMAIFDQYTVQKKNRETVQEISKIYHEVAEKNWFDLLEPAAAVSSFDLFFNSLTKQNPDAAGWLAIPGTPVDYPVVQTTDNDKYLSTDFSGNQNKLGSIFFDYECDLNYEGFGNLVIYGHTTSNQEMFGSLKNYKDRDYFEEHRYLTLYLPGRGEKIYEIFSVIITPALAEDTSSGRDYRQLIFSEKAEFQEWLTFFKSESLYDTGTPADETDRVLTLSTCTYEFSNARLAVMAVEVEPEEAGIGAGFKSLSNQDQEK